MPEFPHPSRSCALAVTVFSLLIAGCGGSSKPSYCSKVSDLEKSVQNLPANVSENGVDTLKSSLQTVETNANAVISSAKSDFPNETTAMKTSLDSLHTTVQQLPSSPTAANLATVGTQVAAAVTSVKNFADSTSSKCG